jgi:hypothetical protein
MTQDDKKGKKVQGSKKRLRNQKIIADHIAGKSNKELQNQYGLSPVQISRILNSKEKAEIAMRLESEVYNLGADALEVVKYAIANRQADVSSALNAAIKVLKTLGAIREKTEVAHSFPKPTVIRRKDGTEIVLGTQGDDE